MYRCISHEREGPERPGSKVLCMPQRHRENLHKQLHSRDMNVASRLIIMVGVAHTHTISAPEGMLLLKKTEENLGGTLQVSRCILKNVAERRADVGCVYRFAFARCKAIDGMLQSV